MIKLLSTGELAGFFITLTLIISEFQHFTVNDVSCVFGNSLIIFPFSETGKMVKMPDMKF